ncbi:MAG: phosphopyruvate hydratase [Candidatus Paceibacterota bacterium]|jgi:enolase
MESKITKILAEEIKDSRGNPTLKVTVWSDDKSDSFSVPSGASTGAHEAHELRDLDGKGVNTAIEKVNNIIAPALIGQDIFNQRKIDKTMATLDWSLNKDNIGGNSMIGVSIACAKTAAKVKGVEVFEYLRTLEDIKPSQEIPNLFINLIEGGKHAKNQLAFQEYHIVPITDNLTDAVDMAIKIQDSLSGMFEKEIGKESTIMGDEGGLDPKINEIRKPLEYLVEAIKQNNLSGKIRLSLDVAASSFFKNGKYIVDGKNISKEELMKIYNSLIKDFNLLAIEDPFDEEDFDDFRKLKENEKDLIVVGDDLTVSNKILLQKALDDKSINAMIIKPNQIGTLSETLETMKLARQNDIKLIVSHRSGETDDDFIADLAYAFGCFGLKTGSPKRLERMVKYQRLIKISKN